MFARLYLFLVGLGFIGTAVLGLAYSEQLMGAVDISLNTLNGFSEVRSNYGGMHLLMGIALLFAATTSRWVRPALLLSILFTGGYTLGRLLSIALDGVPSDDVLILTGVEALGAVLGIIFLSLAKHPRLP